MEIPINKKGSCRSFPQVCGPEREAALAACLKRGLQVTKSFTLVSALLPFALVGLLDAIGANCSYLDFYMGFGWSIKATIHGKSKVWREEHFRLWLRCLHSLGALQAPARNQIAIGDHT